MNRFMHMKKMIYLMLALTICLSVAGCNSAPTAPTGGSSVTTQITTPTTAPSSTTEGTTQVTTVPTTAPAETKPAETKPAETKPAETQPVSPESTTAPTGTTAHAHDYARTVTAPTCTNGGYTTFVCPCGDSYTGDYTDAAGHSYQGTVTPPTCTADGYTAYQCQTCGDHYVSDYTYPAGHTWGQWQITVEATYYDEGSQQRTCSVCSASETQRISRLEMPVEVKQQEILRLVNIEREKEDLPPLQYCSAGQAAADIRAEEITTLFSHERPDGTMCWTALMGLDLDYRGVGENIAYGYPTPEAVVRGWMNSEGHRANILSQSYTHLIVGIEGTYWVQLFLIM